jgi:hypothetical protein
MTDEYVPTGPACDFCDEWPAVGTMMNLADYQTQRFCASCGPKFLLSVVEAMTGAGGGEPEPEGAADPTLTAPGQSAGAPTGNAANAEGAADDPAAIAGADSVSAAAYDRDDDEPGSAADHWASTRNVVKSTHGHRGAARTGKDETP